MRIASRTRAAWATQASFSRLRPGDVRSEPAGIDVHWIPGTPTRHFNIGGRSLSLTSGWEWQTLGYTDNTP